MREGIDHPAGRGARTAGDRVALVAALDRRGVAEPLRTLVLRPSSLPSALPEDQCRAGVALYEALLDLPPDIRSRTLLAVANAVRLTAQPRTGDAQ
jgi:hypothetical protein